MYNCLYVHIHICMCDIYYGYMKTVLKRVQMDTRSPTGWIWYISTWDMKLAWNKAVSVERFHILKQSGLICWWTVWRLNWQSLSFSRTCWWIKVLMKMTEMGEDWSLSYLRKRKHWTPDVLILKHRSRGSKAVRGTQWETQRATTHHCGENIKNQTYRWNQLGKMLKEWVPGHSVFL